MRKQHSTKRALLLSALSLLMCVSMLIGSTFAWFTDSVTSGSNKIQAGNLDIQLLMHNGTDYVDISNSADPIFGTADRALDSTNTLWEPGKTQVAYLAIKNNGSLSLKYKVALDVYTTTPDHKDLYEVMEYAIIADAQPNEVKSWDGGNNVDLGKQIVSENNVPMDPGSVHYFALAIHMPEEAGNQYQNGEVSFDLTVLATQLDAEFDSFGKDYDEDARYPLGTPATVETEIDTGFKFAVSIPAEAPAYNYGLKVVLNEFINDKTNATLKFDMSLVDRDNNNKTVSVPSLEYPVTIQLPHPFVNMDNFQLFHGEDLVSGAVYDEATQTISFTTTGFSEFALKYIDYTDPSFEVKWDKTDNQYTITKGMFFVNPANYFADGNILGKPAVMAADHIAVDFTKDEVKYYIVSDRATSIIVGDADDSNGYDKYDATTGLYSFENGQYPVSMINNNSLCTSAVLTLNEYDHGTLYILPGTYKEQRRLDVYGSMDIIGLGNPEEIRLIKQGTPSTESSHRHLINVSGGSGKAITDHIQVTIHNLYLDATISNGSNGNKDNGAVQSIRRSKVKCYDLTIVKGTGWDAVAFYVNGNNAVDGVKYPAYLYAENCSLNTTRTFGIVTTSGSYKFYHSGLTYNNGTAYTNNSGSTKNITMAADDWTWD